MGRGVPYSVKFYLRVVFEFVTFSFPQNAAPDQWAHEFAQRRFDMNSMARELPSSQWADEFAGYFLHF